MNQPESQSILRTLPVLAAGTLCATGLIGAGHAQSTGGADAPRLDAFSLRAPTAVAPSSPGAAAGLLYEEDFEDGFAVGPIAGQNGWMGTGVITDASPISGALSARHVSSGSGTSGLQMNSPAFPGGTQFGSIAADVRISNNATLYQFIPRDIAVAPPNQFFNTRVQFNPNGNLEVAQVNANKTAFEFIDTGVDWIVGAVHRVCVEVVDAQGELNVYFDGDLVFTGEDTQFVINGESHGIGDYLTFSNNAVAGSSYTIDNFSSLCDETPPPDLCPPDTNDDGTVDVQDLVNVILDWNATDSPADVNDDNIVDVQDLVAVILAWGPCPLLNDDCETAVVTGNGATGFTQVGATLDGSAPAFSCGDAVNDVWFEYTSTCDGNVFINTNGSGFDTVLEVYDEAGCPPTTSLGCDDDSGSGGGTSALMLEVTQGQTLKIRIGGNAGDAEGPGTLNISCAPPGPPVNDACSGAIELVPDGGEVTVTGQTITATSSPEAVPCGGLCPNSPDLWFKVQGTGSLMGASLCGEATNFDTIMVLYCGDDCQSLGCVKGDDEGCGTGGLGVPSELSWCSDASETYWINVQGFSANDVGSFELVVTEGAVCGSPDPCLPGSQQIANDECVDAIELTGDQDLEVNTTGACTDGQQHVTCQFDGQTYHDLWYLYTANCDGTLQVFTCNQSMYDTDLVIYDGTGWPANCVPDDGDVIACNDDTIPLCEDFGAFIELEGVAQGQQFLIRLGGMGEGDQGVTTLSIRCFTPDNDFCELAEPIGPPGNAQGAPDEITDSTCGGTAEAWPSCGGGPVKFLPGRWYSTIGDGTTYTASLCDTVSSFDTRLTVYCGPCKGINNGADCAVLEFPDNCGNNEELSWCTADGAEYLILVHGEADCGEYTLKVTSNGNACGSPPCTCQVTCTGMEEPEPCGDNLNGGCLEGGQADMTPAADGDTWCGTVWAESKMRDTDWYIVQAGATGSVTATLTAELPAAVFVIRDPSDMCLIGLLQIVAVAHSDSCEQVMASFNGLDPGETFYIFVSTEDIFGPIFNGYPCGANNDYRLSISAP